MVTRRLLLALAASTFCACISACREAPIPRKASEDPFARAVRGYFRGAEVCWNTPVPSRRDVETEIQEIRKAARRWWPDQVELAEWNLAGVMLTEGEGQRAGKKKDPDVRRYTPGHVGLWEAKTAVRLYGIKSPNLKLPGGKIWFKTKLDQNVRFGMEVFCGVIYYYYTLADGDWAVAICSYKMGPKRYSLYAMKTGKKASELKVYRGFAEKRQMLWCLSANPERPCPCLKLVSAPGSK